MMMATVISSSHHPVSSCSKTCTTLISRCLPALPWQVDKLSIKENRAEILRLLQRPAEAEKEYESLLAINPDNYK